MVGAECAGERVARKNPSEVMGCMAFKNVVKTLAFTLSNTES